jgi:hypothetical protein
MVWFKHDSNASFDPKLKKLILRYGPEGYAIYFHCLELIASDVKETNITFELNHDAEIIADNLKIKGNSNISAIDKVNTIMEYIIELDLFEESQDHIFCFKLLKRMDQSMTGSSKMRKLITAAKEKNGFVMINHDDVMIYHDDVMNRREEKRTDYNRKEKENNHDIDHYIQHWNTKSLKKYRFLSANIKNSSDILRNLSVYNKEEVLKSIDNYDIIVNNTTYEPFPFYPTGFEGFMGGNGIEIYHDAHEHLEQFKKNKKETLEDRAERELREAGIIKGDVE